MEFKSVVRYARASDLKARMAAAGLKGAKAFHALDMLSHCRRGAGRIIAKAVKSAIAQAEAAKVVDTENLYIKSIQADKGPSLKRFRPRARGASFPFKRQQCHITVELREK